MNGHIEEMFTGHREVKAFNREEESQKIFDAKNKALYEVGWKAQFISGIIMPIMHAVNNLGYIIISVFGAVFVTRRMIEIGDIQAFIQYSRQFSQPIQQVASIANLIQSTIAAAERVFEILNDPEEIQDPDNPVDLSKLQGRVTLEHVDFSYTPEQPLITDLNIDTVRYRIAKMIKSGIIVSFIPAFNYAAMGLNFHVLLVSLPTLNSEKENTLISFLKNNKHTVWSAKTIGKYDIIIYFCTKNSEEINESINELRNIFGDGIQNYDLLIANEEFKYIYFPQEIELDCFE